MNPDFRDLLAAFNTHGVEFIVVGAHALAAHGLIRATKDFDVWIRTDETNAPRVIAALTEFGAPLHGLTSEDLVQPGLIFQIGVEPIRIDVITEIDGVRFEEAWAERVPAKFADQSAPVLSRHHLLANKRASGRDQDLLDVKWLEQHKPKELRKEGER